MRRILARSLFVVGLLAVNGAFASSLMAESSAGYWQKCDWICTGGGGAAQGCEDAWFSSCGQDEYCDGQPIC